MQPTGGSLKALFLLVVMVVLGSTGYFTFHLLSRTGHDGHLRRFQLVTELENISRLAMALERESLELDQDLKHLRDLAQKVMATMGHQLQWRAGEVPCVQPPCRKMDAPDPSTNATSRDAS